MRRLVFVSVKFFLVVFAITFTSVQNSLAGDLPNFEKVEGVVRRHFATLPGYQAGDLISRSQIKPVFASISRLGWRVADQSAILHDTLLDSNYLVQEFRTGKGQQFMRKVAGSPMAFDQLDQISRLPGGKLMVKDFLRFPNSELTFSDKKSVDASQFARFQPRGKQSGITQDDLTKPTGRIYTEDALVSRLQQSHSQEQQRRAASGP